jgi:hypothetical protein
MIDFFDEWYKTIPTHLSVAITVDLIPYIQNVYLSVNQPPYNIESVIHSLKALLMFLSSEAGCTSPNCWATDIFFAVGEGWEWQPYPDALMEVVSDIGGALHDTVDYPDIARNFESTPEQLLIRLVEFENKYLGN